MVPVAYMILDKMPRTTTGKADRRKLREYVSAMTTDELFVPTRSTTGEQRLPSTDAERLLQGLWTWTLKTARTISARENFFLLGGDSIEAMKLVSAVRETGNSLTVADVFKRPVLEDLANQLKVEKIELAETPRPFSLLTDSLEQAERLRESAASAMCVKIDDVEDMYPCTALQEGLLALAAQRSGAYLARNVFPLIKSVDLAHFKRSWGLVEAAALTPFSPFIRPVRSVTRERCLEFWQKKFDGVDAQPFPSLPDAKYQPPADIAVEHTITLTHGAPAGTTMSTVLRAVWALLTMQYTNTNDSIISPSSLHTWQCTMGVFRDARSQGCDG